MTQKSPNSGAQPGVSTHPDADVPSVAHRQTTRRPYLPPHVSISTAPQSTTKYFAFVEASTVSGPS